MSLFDPNIYNHFNIIGRSSAEDSSRQNYIETVNNTNQVIEVERMFWGRDWWRYTKLPVISKSGHVPRASMKY